MNQRGYTAIELSIVLSIAVILVPIVYGFVAHTEDQAALGHWYLDAADGLRSVAEELALDARRGRPLPGEGVGFRIGGCEVHYQVNDALELIRSASPACGGSRGLSTFVESVSWVHGGVELVFARQMRRDVTHRTSAFIPVDRP